MANSTPPLPTPRTLITSLLNTLFTTPPPQTETQAKGNTASTGYKFSTTANSDSNPNTNPLAALPPSHRALLSTLHVIFPPPTLLQALDLLDRGLVTRLVLFPQEDVGQVNKPGNGEGRGGSDLAGSEIPVQAHVHLPHPQVAASQDPSHQNENPRTRQSNPKQPGKASTSTSEQNPLYLVRSSQTSSTSKSRFRDPLLSTSAAGTPYIVHLQAWNCSCAAFAFAAFPASTSSSSSAPWETPLDGDELELDDDENVSEEKEKEKKWEFGGPSLDSGNGAVPICKHLLACLLAERWEGVLGRYVKEREVGSDEMAGWAAGG